VAKKQKKSQNPDPWERVVGELKDRGIKFDVGLNDEDIGAIERQFDFRFPPDLRAFLQTALPIGDGFPDWRNGKPAQLRRMLDTPRDGIVFDVQNGLWLTLWGPKPESLEEAVRIVEDLIKSAPTLIPIFIHRMMPDEPRSAGNPVFSVHQTDIIYYGFDLLHYLRQEFGVATWYTAPSEPRDIRFWDLERFWERWDNGPVAFDNRDGLLPESS
jgi:hypothetical protein